YQMTRTSSASTISSVALIRISSTGFDMSAPLLLGLRDERRQPFQLGLIQRNVGEIEQRGGGRGVRSVEEGVHELSQRRFARALTRHRREVDVAGTVDLVLEMPFRLEHAQQGPHGGVARRIGQPRMHLAGASPAEAVDEIHDLAFATGE